MTVNNVTPTITIEGNGSTTLFSFPMAAPSADTIKAFFTDIDGEVRQLSPAEFSVALNPLVGTNPTAQGGTVNYNPGGTPIPAGSFLTITRILPEVQNTSITNQSIIYPPVVERALDYLTMLGQQDGLISDRSFKVPFGDPLPADVPAQQLRANKTAFFDENGNLTAGTPISGTVFVSAAMEPVVGAATIEDAQSLFGLNKDPKLITNSYVIIPDDNRRTISMEGNAFYLVTANDFTAYPTYFVALFVNNDTRAKTMNIFGFPVQFTVYPMQQVWLARGPNGWLVSRPGRWLARSPQNFFVDPIAGSDLSDGLATGAGAFQTIARACRVVETDVDGDFTINLANGVHAVGTGLLLNKRLPGGTAYKIVGNVASPNNCNLNVNSGSIAIIVSDGAVAEFSGFRINGLGNPNWGIWALRGGVVNFENLIFGACIGGGHLAAFTGTITVTGNYRIASGASAQYHFGAFYNGVGNLNTEVLPPITTPVITLEGPVSFPSGYYLCQLNSTIVNVGAFVSYVNAGFATATPKAQVTHNAVVNAGGAAVPGDIAAIANNGGFFF